jgi:hypothetical protein
MHIGRDKGHERKSPEVSKGVALDKFVAHCLKEACYAPPELAAAAFAALGSLFAGSLTVSIRAHETCSLVAVFQRGWSSQCVCS